MSYKKMPLDGFHNESHRALAGFEDEYRQMARIVIDDGCYVLQTAVEGAHGRGWKSVTHWFPEAAEALAGVIAANIFLKQVIKNAAQPPNTTTEGPWSPAQQHD